MPKGIRGDTYVRNKSSGGCTFLSHSEMKYPRGITDIDTSCRLVSDIAIFVLKRDVKLQLTNVM